MHRIDMTILLLVGTQIPALNPDLETTPRCADIGVDTSSVVRIIGESHFEGEHLGVTCEPLPSNSHVTNSIPMIPDVSSLQTTFVNQLRRKCCTDLFGEFFRRIIHGRYSRVAQRVEELCRGHRGQFRGLNQSQMPLFEQAQCECAVDID